MDDLTDMDRRVLSILYLLMYVKPEADLAIAVQKFNHQKDMSEYCRRRVAPSVFLGKQVMDASAQIMHFSQLDVPYSCTMSVRTESGNNIIMVIQLLSGAGLMDACARNSNQLIVYEFGETFGGYWGHLPDTMIKKTTRNYTRFYTLKTTKPTTIRRTKDFKTDTPKILMNTIPMATDRPKNFIRMEVPLVNVSGNFQLGPPQQTYNTEEMFDFIYDVTPKNGVEYETSVLPLVQFSIKKQTVGPESYDTEQRYELDYAFNRFTIDPRLLFSTLHKRVSTRKRKWSSSRRLNFRKKNFRKLFTPRSKSYFVKNRSFTKTVAPTRNSIAWEIETPFSQTTVRSTLADNITKRNILDKIYNIDYDISVYVTPNDQIYKNNKLFSDNEAYVKLNLGSDLDSQKTMHPITFSGDTIKDNLSSSTLLVKAKKLDAFMFNNNRFKLQTGLDEKIQSTQQNRFTLNTVNKYDIVTENISTVMPDNPSINNISTKNCIEQVKLGTMVGHESWENIVQAAPVMAVVLNKSEMFSNKSRQGTEKLTKVDRRTKKKRHIYALEIEGSRPRNLTTQRSVTTEIGTHYLFSDIQDLAGLVELQDDEIAGRLALRYLRNYVGSVLFNICDFQEAKSRQVFLFNASRIVIAVNNFTMEGMTLVLTPAQSLVGSMSLCEPGYLECQIIGSRVCIDSMNACDTVPNCGSYDIYDEDRLKCGVTKGLQHNVYIAAFTFLAVILITLCTVHYWLKRCVPRVSDAFFLYTDAAENTLFLDSIMRSPNDVDESSYKCAYPGRFFDNDILNENGLKEADINENFCRRFMRKCCALLLCKKRRVEHSDYVDEVYSSAPLDQPNMFSFAEYELRKFALREEGVQTGESLEMHFENYTKEKKDEYGCDMVKDSGNYSEVNYYQSDSDKYIDELKLIKLIKETRSSSQFDALPFEQREGKMARRHVIVTDDEKEIKSTLYERDSNTNIATKNIRVECEVHPEKLKTHVDITKRLRFDEELTMIPSVKNDEEITIDTMESRRSIALGAKGRNNQDLDMITQMESEASSSRDFMRFWGTSKGKKGKKKKEKNLQARYY
ncbi:uncharacterized protein LOC123864496 [Maniola jurtina]|uniref:uncharacterized protein LOC123864496 n=1 Tax=Maniola jurtina TaxID=191418 RepID=UPI001E68FD5A|nr:uncharacterized protein LOC123864496 [Maniola jurtina]